MAYYMKRVEMLTKELEYMQQNTDSETRMKELGHPKDLQDKLFTACESVKSTYDDLPKLVERMEQRKKVHEVCAKVMLGISELETQ